jgi:hypothetical protein
LRVESKREKPKNWAAFQANPEWKKVKAKSEANEPLLDRMDRYFMDPTSDSAAVSHTHEACFGIGAAALLLLFIGIHNAWDGVVYHMFAKESDE